MNSSQKLALSSTIALSVVLGLTLQKIFSTNMARFEPRNILRSEKSLLLSNADGFLPDAQARKVIRGLEAFVSKTHTVQKSEWLEKIAQEYGIPALSLRSTNNLEDPQVRPSQEVLVQNKKGMVHVVKEAQSLDSVIEKYEKMGSKREKILAMNLLDEVSFIKGGTVYLREGARLWIPDAWRSFPILFRPVVWSRISSRFGVRRHPLLKVKRWHEGFDMVAPYGAPVYAGEAGIVTFAGWFGSLGNVVEIRHSKNTTRYGHLSKILVEVGRQVKRKQMVGRVGSTGLSTGPHLHFEVRRNSDGKVLNPRRFLF
jgi:murein DD-endopeptidase MepM/ murein hydrolase activator NlpD